MVISSSNMNAAVHTSTSVHRCRDDILGTSAIYLTAARGGRSRQMQRSCQNCKWNVSSTWGWVGVDTSRETTCPPAPSYGPEPPVIGSVKFSDRLTIVPWVVICPPGRIEVVGHWASTLAALAVDTNVQTTPMRPTCLPFRSRLPENTTSSPRLKPGAPTSIFASNSVNTAST